MKAKLLKHNSGCTFHSAVIKVHCIADYHLDKESVSYQVANHTLSLQLRIIKSVTACEIYLMEFTFMPGVDETCNKKTESLQGLWVEHLA